MTPADWAALQAAGAAGGTQYLEALNAQNQAVTAQKQSLLAGVPGAPGAQYPGNNLAALSTEFGVGQDAIAAVYQQYPNLAWMLSVPNLGPLIIQWAQAGTDPAVAESEFESSLWYQQHADSARKYIQEVETDPAQAQADVAAQQASVEATVQSLGLNYQPQQITDLATQSLVQGWTQQQLKDQISQAITINPDGSFSFKYAGITANSSGVPGGLQANVDAVNAEAGKFLVPISGQTAQNFAKAMADGTMDAASVTSYFQHQAEGLYPSIAGALQKGITVADYVTPYKEVAAQLLGVDPATIDMSKPQYTRALTQPGPNGVPQAMSLYAWQQTLMQDPQYGYMKSVNAKDRASSLAQGIAEMFGKSPSGPAGSTAFTAAGAPRIAGVPIT